MQRCNPSLQGLFFKMPGCLSSNALEPNQRSDLRTQIGSDHRKENKLRLETTLLFNQSHSRVPKGTHPPTSYPYSSATTLHFHVYGSCEFPAYDTERSVASHVLYLARSILRRALKAPMVQIESVLHTYLLLTPIPAAPLPAPPHAPVAANIIDTGPRSLSWRL
jgi:hypothetical protein